MFRRKKSRQRGRGPGLDVRRTLTPSTGLSWACHVCGAERPDERISVYVRSHYFANGVRMRENIRYCNDDPECMQGSYSVHHINPDSESLDG